MLLVEDGTCLAVDFGGASGAEGMLVMKGRGVPRDDVITAGGVDFSFKFLTTGEEPKPGVEGDRVLVGDQTVSIRNGKIVLAKMAGIWQERTSLPD